jgi:phosphatidylserine decarboxylase
MSIHKEGYKILIIGLVILLFINIIADIVIADNMIIKWGIGFCSIILFVFLLFFFRLPERSLEPNQGIIYAPADGKVVAIEETEEKEYFKDMRIQISIFMSPFNMHSNRYPVSGHIKYVAYHAGHKMVAWHPKSSELNERSTVVIETVAGIQILIRQVAGAVARRIVTYSKVDQDIKQGDELGFIKFGSRVDIFLPIGTEIEVPILHEVKANKTIIARF